MRMAEESSCNIITRIKIVLDSFTKEGFDKRLVNLKIKICDKN